MSDFRFSYDDEFMWGGKIILKQRLLRYPPQEDEWLVALQPEPASEHQAIFAVYKPTGEFLYRGSPEPAWEYKCVGIRVI